MSLRDELDIFGQLFNRHLNDSMKATLRWVIPTEVDWDAQTMIAVDGDGLEFYDVLLGVGTTAVKPVKGTDCLIAIIEGDEATAFMLYADEAELIQFNGGDNGGLTIVPELKKQLDKMTARIDGIVDAINDQSVVATPQDGGTALLSLLRAQIAKIQDKEKFDDIEDTKITH